jgi:hypothetical protein
LKAWVWTETLDSYLNVAVETAKTAGQVLKLTLAHCRISEFPVWLVGCLPSLLAWPISLLNSVTLSYSLSTGVLICSEFDPAVCPFFLLIFFQIILSNFNNSKTVEHKGKVDLVTETDKACESLIFEYLKTAFPSHQVRDLQFVIEFLACSDSVVSLLFCSLLACLHS